MSPPEPVRRAPYADNPRLGERGQRTRQKILDAALEGFAERGYHRCSVDTITAIAGCSRVSFYQYFESKEDLFRNLALDVTAALRESTKQVDPITADRGGWDSLRAWVARYRDVYERYGSVFHAFPAAVENDAQLAVDSLRTYQRLAHLGRHVDAGALPQQLDDVLYLLELNLPRVLHDLSILEAAAPAAYGNVDVLEAYTDVAHRALFGVVAGVNVHEARGRKLPRLVLGPVMSGAFRSEGGDNDGGPSRAALLDAARVVFVERGYHGTRVDDIAERAGVSHGALYRYFKNKDDVALRLAAGALDTVSATFARIPHDPNQLEVWLAAYNRAYVDEAAMLRVWTDAALQDEALVAESAAVLDWGRRRMVQFLEPRLFGNPDVEAVVLVAFLDAFGRAERSAVEIDAAAEILRRGFLGIA